MYKAREFAEVTLSYLIIFRVYNFTRLFFGKQLHFYTFTTLYEMQLKKVKRWYVSEGNRVQSIKYRKLACIVSGLCRVMINSWIYILIKYASVFHLFAPFMIELFSIRRIVSYFLCESLSFFPVYFIAYFTSTC